MQFSSRLQIQYPLEHSSVNQITFYLQLNPKFCNILCNIFFPLPILRTAY